MYDVTFSGSALAHHNDTVSLGFLTRGSPDNWISVNVRDTGNRPLPCCQTLGADERRLTFSEHMRGIDATDFAVHGAKIAVVAAGSKADYDLSVSGEDVIPVRAPISVYINRESDITDLAGNALRVPRPPTTIVLPSSAATPR